MSEKVIEIEKLEGPFKALLDRVIRMVPNSDKEDPQLRRLLAFRLRIDGEGATQEYLIRKIRDYIQCGFKGPFYEFIKDDLEEKVCLNRVESSDDASSE